MRGAEGEVLRFLYLCMLADTHVCTIVAKANKLLTLKI